MNVGGQKMGEAMWLNEALPFLRGIECRRRLIAHCSDKGLPTPVRNSVVKIDGEQYRLRISVTTWV